MRSKPKKKLRFDRFRGHEGSRFQAPQDQESKVPVLHAQCISVPAAMCFVISMEKDDLGELDDARLEVLVARKSCPQITIFGYLFVDVCRHFSKQHPALAESDV